MFLHAQLVKQDVVLRTQTQVLPNPLHLRTDVVTVDGGRTGGWREQPRQDGPEAADSVSILRTHYYISSLALPPYMVVVLPAPLCPRKETTWFSCRFRLRLLRASLLPVL